MAVIVDTGALYAVADADDQHHRAVADFVNSTSELLIVPSTVIPETSYLINKYLGVEVELKVLQAIRDGELKLEHFKFSDLARIIELVSVYADARIGFVDASIVAIAERLGVTKILTLDGKHFRMFKPRHVEYFEVYP